MKTVFMDLLSFQKRDNSHFSYKNETKLKTSHKNPLIQIHMRKYEEITGYGQDMQVCVDSKHFC